MNFLSRPGGSAARRPKRLYHSKWFRYGISAVATCALLLALLRVVPLRLLGEVFGSFTWEILLAYMALSLLGLFVRALRYRWLLKAMLAQGPVPTFSQLVVITGIRNAFVDFLPARLGEVSYLMALGRYGVNLVSAAASFALCLALDIVVLLGITFLLFLFFVAASPLLPDVLGASDLQMAPDRLSALLLFLGVVCAVVGGLLWMAPQILAWVHRVAERMVCAQSRLSGFAWARFVVGGLARMSSDLRRVKESGSYGRLVFSTLVLRVAKYSSMYILLHGVLAGVAHRSDPINPFVAFVAFLSAEASATLPIGGLMGFGTYEAAWTLVFHLARIELPKELVLAIGLSIHVVTQLFAYTIGVICLLLVASNREETVENSEGNRV